MSLSPRVRCVALAVAALFASPTSLYAHWLSSGTGLVRGIVSSPATAVAVLVTTSFLSHAWNTAVRASARD